MINWGVGRRYDLQVLPANVLIESGRSEEHTSELQSHSDLVCRLLLEKKKKQDNRLTDSNNHNPSHVRQYVDDRHDSHKLHLRRPTGRSTATTTAVCRHEMTDCEIEQG